METEDSEVAVLIMGNSKDKNLLIGSSILPKFHWTFAFALFCCFFGSSAGGLKVYQ